MLVLQYALKNGGGGGYLLKCLIPVATIIL